MDYVDMTIGGRLTSDPEVFSVGSNNGVNFSVAVKSYAGKDNEKRTDFFDCVAWGKQAEIIGKHFSKGSSILVRGKPRIEKYETKDGQKGKSFRLTVNEFSFADSGGGNGNGDGSDGGEVTRSATPTKTAGRKSASQVF